MIQKNPYPTASHLRASTTSLYALDQNSKSSGHLQFLENFPVFPIYYTECIGAGGGWDYKVRKMRLA